MNSINCRGKMLSLEKPLVMAIVNVTPDSFYDGGLYENKASIQKRVEQVISEGADIIDVGGMSSRPGADMISPQEEWDRVAVFFDVIHEMDLSIPISIDTCHSLVASKAVAYGASIINDISGGDIDPKIIDVVIDHDVPYIMMHMRGTPQNMQTKTTYDDIALDLLKEFKEKLFEYRKKGLKDIIIDPGFGFSKNLDQNYELVNKLSVFRLLDSPILVGISRKSMIYKLLETTPDDAIIGTATLHMELLRNGANILRVHDVKEAKQVISISEKLKYS